MKVKLRLTNVNGWAGLRSEQGPHVMQLHTVLSVQDSHLRLHYAAVADELKTLMASTP